VLVGTESMSLFTGLVPSIEGAWFRLIVLFVGCLRVLLLFFWAPRLVGCGVVVIAPTKGLAFLLLAAACISSPEST
jgi:hypothetical protein